ncbi:hypothetical protein MmiHf6_06210 [Methanimicrococcus hongohii]|uniref:Uncharacterized protein n=1 Tax=Methanimicrococcus hongohii TaxID=3028295 RepID=A0AA96ZTK5_9EURY|nr:hypothetical protein [Methanimicrococcus sp. Hf6]WNY23316.1 hypothetical protein MmiHf6_06210 [Methanimicrococcus sp. Hf6]
MIELVNLTPHDVVYIDVDGVKHIFESKGVFRVPTERVLTRRMLWNGMEIPVYKLGSRHDKAKLPDEIDDVFYIVSGIAREAFPGRKDFISPATASEDIVRGTNGTVVGVKSFVGNDK